jgi:aminotransferase
MTRKNILSERVLSLQQGGIRAFFDKAKNYADTINLGIGEPDMNTPEPICDAASRAMRQGRTHYTANAGIHELREKIADYLSKFGVRRSPSDEIIVTCGAMGALSMLLMCTIDKGDEVLIQDPQWLNYASQIALTGGVPVRVPVYEQNNFLLNPEDLESRIRPAAKIIMLNSPNNPTGAVLDRSILERIADIAVKNDLLVVSDEVYCELLYDGREHVSIASFDGMEDRTVVINSLSKTFAMTGWRVGYAAGRAELVKKMTYLQENLVSCAPALSQYAGIYALDNMCGAAEMRETYARRRNILVNGLNSIENIECRVPAGAFYAFPNIKRTGYSSNEFAESLLEEAHVVVIPGSAFGENGEGYLRISYAASEEEIKEAVTRIKCFSDKCAERRHFDV